MHQLSSPVVLPASRGLFHGGAWHRAASGASVEVCSPATGALPC